MGRENTRLWDILCNYECSLIIPPINRYPTNVSRKYNVNFSFLHRYCVITLKTLEVKCMLFEIWIVGSQVQLQEFKVCMSASDTTTMNVVMLKNTAYYCIILLAYLNLPISHEM